MARPRLVVPLLGLVLVFLASALPAEAQKWVFLGQRHVTDKVERDSIEVTASEGTFAAIRIGVKRSAVRFVNVTVVYGTGASDDLELRETIPAGGRSRVLDLRGASRVIKRIDFVYEAKSLGRRGAIVEISGRR